MVNKNDSGLKEKYYLFEGSKYIRIIYKSEKMIDRSCGTFGYNGTNIQFNSDIYGVFPFYYQSKSRDLGIMIYSNISSNYLYELDTFKKYVVDSLVPNATYITRFRLQDSAILFNLVTKKESTYKYIHDIEKLNIPKQVKSMEFSYHDTIYVLSHKDFHRGIVCFFEVYSDMDFFYYKGDFSISSANYKDEKIDRQAIEELIIGLNNPN